MYARVNRIVHPNKSDPNTEEPGSTVVESAQTAIIGL